MSCLETLKDKGLKLTPQRRLIADIIHNAEGHITAEDIIASVQAKMPGVNKSTIYRTLDILEETGCVYKSETHDQFIYHHAEEGHHHHLVCRNCGKTISINENLFSSVERALAEKYGFRVSFKHVVISGLCEDCKKERNKRT
jgi:Fur family transcriptional regulator, ferric uptake regulator